MDLHNLAPWPQHPKLLLLPSTQDHPESKVHRANMGPIWGREDPGGPHVGPMNLAIRANNVIDRVGTDGMLSYQCLAVLLLMPGVEPNPGGVLRKNLDGVTCAAPVFDRIPLAKEILVKNIPLAKENFLIMSPFLHNVKEFRPKYSLFKRNFPKTDANLTPKCQFLGFFVKNIPLAKDFGRKICPWLRNFCQKYTLA